MDSLLVEVQCSSGKHNNTYEVYMIHTNLCAGVYIPWNSFDVWLHYSICICIYTMRIEILMLYKILWISWYASDPGKLIHKTHVKFDS